VFGAVRLAGCSEVPVSTVFRPTLVIALAVLALGAVGCGSSGNKSSSNTSTTSPAGSGTTAASPTSTAASGGSDNITIQHFKFGPETLSVKQGSKVTVAILDDGVPHSVTADDGSFDTGIFMKSNGPKTITVSKGGTIKYHCQVHSFMHGTINAS
jgi:plastocyanin